MNKCPMCEKELATYHVSRLGEDGLPQEREVGCAKENAPCLLAGHSWPLSKWDELCQMLASADEGYPGAECGIMDLLHQLDTLVHTWSVFAELLAEVHPASPANAAFRKCAGELLYTLKEGKYPHARNN